MSSSIPRRQGISLPLALALLVAASATACSSGALDLGFGVAVTATFDENVSDSVLATATKIVVVPSGDETGSYDEPLGTTPLRTEQFLYRPGPATRHLTLTLIAVDSSGAQLAKGASDMMTLVAGKTARVTIDLSASSTTDGGVDGGGHDGGGHDGGDGGSTPLDVTFRAARLITTASSPRAVVTGDLNGDSKADVAVAAQSAGKVQIFFTTAGGTLPDVSDKDLTAAIGPTALVIADMNGDSKNDLVVADGAAGKVLLIVGDGAGGFSPPVTLFTVTAPDALVVADFDQDGRLDVAASSNSVTGVTVYYSGITATTTTLSTSAPVSRLRAPRLDSDEYPDLVMVEPLTNTIAVLLDKSSTTARTFGAPATLTISAVVDVVFADLAGTGVLTGLAFVKQNISDGEGVALNNDGMGMLTISTTKIGIVGDADTEHVEVGDLDNDGKPDVVATYQADAQGVAVAWGDSTTSWDFQTPAAPLLYLTERGPSSVSIAKLNNDDFDDIVVGNQGSNSIAVLYSSGSRAYSASYAEARVFTTVGLRAYDYNADGKLDYGCYVTYGQQALALAPGDGAGHFTDNPPALNLGAMGSPSASAIGDLRGQGTNIDVAYPANDGNLWIALGSGPGQFATPTSTVLNGTGTRYFDVAMADVDNDGKQDVVVIDGAASADTESANMLVFSGKGDGTIGPATSYAAPGALQLVVADLDGDKLNDVLVLTAMGQVIFFKGQQKAPLSIGVGQGISVSHPTGMAILQANGDAKLDLAVSGDTVHLLTGVGDGTFVDSGQIYGDVATNGISIANVDGDPYSDLVAIGDSRFIVLRGNGTGLMLAGTFAAGIFVNGTTNRQFAVGDFYSKDGAKQDDVLVSGGGSTSLVINTTL